MRQLWKHTQQGFSLVELIIVVSIIGLLTTIGMVSYTQASANSRDGKRKADLEQVRAALVFYRTDQGSYPVSVDWATMAPINNYISVPSLKDPKGASYVYTQLNSGAGFSVCATMEKQTPSSYCVYNP